MSHTRPSGRSADVTALVTTQPTAARAVSPSAHPESALALSGSASSKLASVLLEWGRMGGGAGALEFRMPLTHEELGNMAGLSRETVTRLLAKFRREGMVKQKGETMALPQPEVMERKYC